MEIVIIVKKNLHLMTYVVRHVINIKKNTEKKHGEWRKVEHPLSLSKIFKTEKKDEFSSFIRKMQYFSEISDSLSSFCPLGLKRIFSQFTKYNFRRPAPPPSEDALNLEIPMDEPEMQNGSPIKTKTWKAHKENALSLVKTSLYKNKRLVVLALAINGARVCLPADEQIELLNQEYEEKLTKLLDKAELGQPLKI